MAIYYAKVNIISRGKGRSAVAAAAYRSGERIRNNYDGVLHNYTRKSGVVYAQILLPKNAPSRFADRGTLWNEVEAGERKNGRLAREVVLALPREFGQEEQKAAVEEYCQTFTGIGMIADYAIHDKGDGNPHAHIMLTDRPLTADGFAKKKNRDWNKDELIEEWRAAWAEICNRRLPQQERIDHRSYERRGYKGITAYVHEGVAARKIEQRGGVSYRCEMNRRIRADRHEMQQLIAERKQLIEAQKQQQEQQRQRQRREAEAAREIERLKQEECEEIDRVRAGIARRKRAISTASSGIAGRNYAEERQGASHIRADGNHQRPAVRDYVAEAEQHKIDATEREIARISKEREATARAEREAQEREQRLAAESAKRQQQSRQPTKATGKSHDHTFTR